ncbi:MAG: zinc ribbon domain-containing protein [Lachnospiraceae bacterium]
MDFFDKLGEKLAATGEEISQKAKEMTEVVSLKNQIRTQENQLDEIYKSIGKKYYEAHKDEEGNEYAADFESIKTAQAGIATLNAQIREVKGTKVCPVCGEDIVGEASFCPKCGAKING